MKLVKIFKNSTLSFFGRFESGQEAQEWIDSCISSNAWGLSERPELDSEGNPTGNILPAEFSIEVEDISAQIEQEKINAEAKKFLSDSDWKCQRHADQKALGISPSLSEEEFQALLLARQEARNRIK